MKVFIGKIGVVFLMGIIFNMGCATSSREQNTRQADIGFGIVEGTKGYQQIQKEFMSTNESTVTVQGQVFQIEGAAYVVHTRDNFEVRLPIDENTRIDRPAHVGDWIQAYLDQAGRARFIQNIDDQIDLE